MTRRRRLLVVGPTAWDREELDSPRFGDAFEWVFPRQGDGHVAGRPGFWGLLRGFDVLRYVDGLAREFKGCDGVIGTDEYLACSIAAAVARRLDLPHCPPEAILLCQHKFYSRQAQREVVPECVPEFALVDPSTLRREDLPLPFPMFVKPVRGTFSILARRVERFEELAAFLKLPWVQRHFAMKLMVPFNDLLRRYTAFERDANCFLAEGVLGGALVTVEGFVRGPRVEILGITDSVLHPGTISFTRFDYPSRLPAPVQARMGEIVRRVVPRLGLDNTVFNVEMFWRQETDSIHIVEVNPRMAYQFSDLYEKVEGFSTYDVQLALACGEDPVVRRGAGRHGAASSFVFRRFEDARLVSAPSPAQQAEVVRRFPGTRIRLYGTPGRRVSEIQMGVESHRYAVVNMGGESWDDLEARFGEAKGLLEFRFDPC